MTTTSLNGQRATASNEEERALNDGESVIPTEGEAEKRSVNSKTSKSTKSDRTSASSSHLSSSGSESSTAKVTK